MGQMFSIDLSQVKFIAIIFSMNTSNERIDLNLFRVFFAIWDLRSLTAAGERLGLTQPAISHALRRLRERFDDPLFVRVANRMVPTDTAIRLHDPLDQAFDIINRALQRSDAFDPSTSKRTFRLAMTDVAEAYSLPKLMTTLARVAPLTRIDILPLAPETIASSMRSGEIDLAIASNLSRDEDFTSTATFSDRYICMVRAGHPVARAKLSRSSFTKLRFFYARMTSTIHHLAERWLADGDAPTRIAVRGHFTAAPEIVRNSDLAAIFPRLLALDLHRVRDFVLLELPFGLPAMDVKVYSHPRFSNDAGIRWLAKMSAELLIESAERLEYRNSRRQTRSGPCF